MNRSRDFWEKTFRGVEPAVFHSARLIPEPSLEAYLDKHVQRGGTILDVGCGEGRKTTFVAGQGRSVVGLDFASSAIDVCAAMFAFLNLSGKFVKAAMDRLPFRNGSFDGVVGWAVMDHVTLDEARAALKEKRRVLKPGGAILLSFDDPDTVIDSETEILDDGTLRVTEGRLRGMLFRPYLDDEIRELVGEDRILDFTKKSNGTRVVVCN